MSESAQALIYSQQGVMTLVSRAWNLVRLNLRDSLTLILAPTLLFALASLLLSIPASLTFLTEVPAAKVLLSIGAVFAGVIIGIVAFIFWAFSCCVLMRFYHSAIVKDKPDSIQSCWQFARRSWQSIALLIITSTTIMAGITIINFVILFLGMLISVAAFTALGSYSALSGKALTSVMMVVFMVLWGFVVLTVMISLMTMEGFLFMCPFVSFSTAEEGENMPWWRHLGRSYKILFANAPRAIVFALVLFLFSLVLSVTLFTPAYVWLWLEITRLGVSQQHHLPFYLQAGLNLWSSVVNLFLMPFYISAMTLFWYDCRVRKEALDLRLWLDAITRRRGKQMQGNASPAV